MTLMMRDKTVRWGLSTPDQRRSKTVMKRYILTEHTPQCTRDTQKIQEHYEAIWSASANPFTPAREGEMFHLKKMCAQ